MIKALLDTNVIIDIALERFPFYEEAVAIFQKIHEQKVSGYISATSVTDIFYILRKAKVDAVEHIKQLLQIVDVLGIDKPVIINALYSGWYDFEDAVQARVAVENELDAIITRNVKDFQNLKKPEVFTPLDFIAWAE